MNLSAILVTALPDKLPGLNNQISLLPWAETHFHDEEGRLIVTVESMSIQEDQNYLRELQALPGTLSAEVVEFWPNIEN